MHHDEDAFEDEEVDVDDLPESMKPKLEKRKFRIDFLTKKFSATSFDFGLAFRCLYFTRKIATTRALIDNSGNGSQQDE